MKKKFFFLLTFIQLLFSSVNFAQKAKIIVLDATNNEPCGFVNVALYDSTNQFIAGSFTDSKGEVEFEINEKLRYEISAIGYEDCGGYISPNETVTCKMKMIFIDINEIIITGQYQAQKNDQSIYKIDVINSKTIQERGVTNLAEALSNEVGIRLSIDPSTGTSVKMQGMGGENIKYLIDGIPIVGRVDGNIDLSQINMENVDHIEIVQGPMSVVYGTSALAGVVNIITKQNTTVKNIVKFNTYSDTKYNYNFGGFASFLRGKHGLTFSANRDMFQGIDVDLNVDNETGTDRYMEFKPKRVFNSDLEYSYRNKDLNLKVKTQFMNLLLKSYSNPNPLLITYDADYYTTRSTNSLSLVNKLSQNLSIDFVAAYTYYTRNSDFFEKDLSTLENTFTNSKQTTFHNAMTRGSFVFARPASILSYQFGWDFNYDIGNGDKIADGAEMGDFALFAGSQIIVSDKMTLQPGLRYIYNTVYKAPLIPSFNFQWQLFENFNFRASYAKGFRAPSLKELYLDFKDSNHNLEGNTDLKAESTDSYNASLSYVFKESKYLFKIEPSFFFNNGKDVITLIVTDATTNSATNTNLGARKTFGSDITISYLKFKGLTLGAGYSITGETYDYEGTNTFTPTTYYNNYTFSIKYNWRKYKTIFNSNLKVYGETPSIAQDDDTEEYYQVFAVLVDE